MKKGSLCPICEEGNLSERVSKNRVNYKGKTTELDSHFSVCASCGSEQANAQQVRTNKRYMVAFKKQVEGLLTGSEVRSVREKLGLKQSDAAKIFGGGPVAFSKYETDDVTQSEAMDKLLRVAAEVLGAFDYLAKSAQVHVDVYRTHHATGRTVWDILPSVCLPSSGQGWMVHEYVNSPLGFLDTSIYEVPFGKDELMLPRTVKLPHHYDRDFSGEYAA